MNYGILIVVVVIVVVIGLLVKECLDSKRKTKITEEDFRNLELRSVLEYSIIKNLIDDTRNKIRDLRSITNDSKDNVLIFEMLEENCNNIEVVTDDLSLPKDFISNFYDDIIFMINNFIPNNKCDICFNDNKDTMIVYDKYKLISSIKHIILKSLENGIKNKIKIKIDVINKSLKKINYKIKLENVNLIKKSSIKSLDKIFETKCISKNLDSSLLIIRENLLRMDSVVEFIKDHDRIDMIITVELQKAKKERKNINALIVDDNEYIAKMHKEILEELNVKSDIVYNAEDCINKIKNDYENYDIIFTDNQMPNMNGPELFEELKEIEGFDLPVVIITGDSGEDHYFKNVCGFNDYIVKPLTKKAAKKVIKKCLEIK